VYNSEPPGGRRGSTPPARPRRIQEEFTMTLSPRFTRPLVSPFLIAVAFALFATGTHAEPADSGSPRNQVTAAQSEVAAARKDMDRIRAKVAATFQGTADFTAAREKMVKASSDYDAAVRKAKAALLTNADYKAALTKRDAARAKLDAANDPPDEAANTAFTEAVTAIKKMENAEVDASADVAAARDALEGARKDVATLDEQVTGALKADPEYAAARQRLTAAEQALAAARKSATDAAKAGAAGKAAAARSKNPSPAPPKGKGKY
jgi:chromosome segregation ATPase